MTGLDTIPSADAPPADARPSDVVARLRGYRPDRRTVLRTLVIGAAAAALVPMDWYLTRREAAAATPNNRSEYGTCHPAQYDEEPNNWPKGGEAVCYGGWKRGSYPCEGGYHREGRFSDGDTAYDSTRLTTNCNGRNAWRWKGYRCSDAITTATFDDGTEYTAVTMAACTLTAAELAHPLPVEPDDPYDKSDGDDESGGR